MSRVIWDKQTEARKFQQRLKDILNYHEAKCGRIYGQSDCSADEDCKWDEEGFPSQCVIRDLSELKKRIGESTIEDEKINRSLYGEYDRRLYKINYDPYRNAYFWSPVNSTMEEKKTDAYDDSDYDE
jgi:hypothetical protein